MWEAKKNNKKWLRKLWDKNNNGKTFQEIEKT